MQQQFSETLDNRQCRTVIPERKETNKVRYGLPGRPRWASGKETAASAGDTETGVQSLGREDPLEEGTATHSSILAWRVSWTEEPGGLQYTELKRIGHDWSDLDMEQQTGFK